jgi:hypothetical protein
MAAEWLGARQHDFGQTLIMMLMLIMLMLREGHMKHQ